MVRNTAVEAKNKIITIKAAMQPVIRNRHPRTFMVILGRYHLIQMVVFGSSFQSKGGNYMVAEAI